MNPHALRHTPLKRTCLPFHHPSVWRVNGKSPMVPRKFLVCQAGLSLMLLLVIVIEKRQDRSRAGARARVGLRVRKLARQSACDRAPAIYRSAVSIQGKPTTSPTDARVVKWQTRTFEGRMPQGVGVQVPPRAEEKIGRATMCHTFDRFPYRF